MWGWDLELGKVIVEDRLREAERRRGRPKSFISIWRRKGVTPDTVKGDAIGDNRRFIPNGRCADQGRERRVPLGAG